MPKSLKIDLQAKPQSTPEDQFLFLNLLGESFNLASINSQIFENSLRNAMLEAFSSEFTPRRLIQSTLIPESPSSQHESNLFDSNSSFGSPRSIISPYFQPEAKNFSEVINAQQKNALTSRPSFNKLPRVEPIKDYSLTKSLQIPNYTQQDENDIISSICQSFPTGFTIHTQHQHPCIVKAQNLSKTLGRSQFEPDEELRVVNDVILEGVFGVPGFLGWTCLPMILAHYGKQFTVDQIASELLSHGELIQAFLTQNSNQFILTPQILRKWYGDMIENRPLSQRFFNCVKRPDRKYLDIYDIQRICYVLLKLHPGLAFLQDAVNFQQLYAQTVSYRVLFENDVGYKGYLQARDLKAIQTESGTKFSPDVLPQESQPGLLEAFWQSQFEQDINKNYKCFSYEHFYVFYVSFWELDLDHDKCLTLYDLERYQQNTLPKPVAQRIFDSLIEIRQKMPSLYVDSYREIYNSTPKQAELANFLLQKKLYYPDFVRFLIYLENPDLDVSSSFMFQILDLDGDEAINFDDFDYFFRFQQDKMEANGVDLLDSRDLFCQLLDFYSCHGKIDMKSLKKSQCRGNLFSVMAHYQRLMQFDQKDPYTMKNYLMNEKTMWEKYCRRMYDQQVQGNQGDGF